MILYEASEHTIECESTLYYGVYYHQHYNTVNKQTIFQ